MAKESTSSIFFIVRKLRTITSADTMQREGLRFEAKLAAKLGFAETTIDKGAAHMAINDFIIAELGIPYIVDSDVFAEDEEKIPNTIAPYHFTLTAHIDASGWLKSVA